MSPGDGGPADGGAPDGLTAVALLTAWLGGDTEQVTALVEEAAAGDPRPLLTGLAYLSATTTQAYAEAAALPVQDVLALLGQITTRRAAGREDG